MPVEHLTTGEAVVKCVEAIASYGVDLASTPVAHSLITALIIWWTIILVKQP
jgi:hypothetical protein